MAFFLGCETPAAQSDVLEIPEPCEPNLPEPPSEVNETICIVITSEPNNAIVYSVDVNQQDQNLKLTRKLEIGTTPLEIPVKFWKNEQQTWFEASDLGTEERWGLDAEERKYTFRFYLKKQGFYPVFMNTSVYFIIDNNELELTPEQTLRLFDDPCSPVVYNCSVQLMDSSGRFARIFANAVEENKFSYAEDLRLQRIETLTKRIQANNQFLNNWPLEDGQTNDDAAKSLISLELDMLEHTVGLADPQLMEFRKRLVGSLQQGDLESAYVLAKLVVFREEKYLPDDKPFVLNLPYTKPLTERSSYGAQHIADSLYYIRMSELTKQKYQYAFEDIKLIDVIGFETVKNK
jgi:hypothetical protein